MEVYIICYDNNTYDSLRNVKIGSRSNVFYLPEFPDKKKKEETDKEGEIANEEDLENKNENNDVGNFEFLNKLLKGEKNG